MILFFEYDTLLSTYKYQSAGGNELHQLADIICAYERKDWNSYFKEVPLADDDFMPDRLNFKSTFSFEEITESEIPSSVPLNANIDNTKIQLLESITRAVAKHPELRLGQLLVNALSASQLCLEVFHIESPELFQVKDELLTEKINLLYL